MTISTTVKLAKEKGAKYYKDRDFLESIKEYSIAIDNGDSNDNELHLYYRYGRLTIFAVLTRSLKNECFHIRRSFLILQNFY